MGIKVRHKNQILILGLLTLNFVLFQNWNFVRVQGVQRILASTADAQYRLQHARELLGKYYSKSSAKKSENLMDLQTQIEQKLEKNLPTKYKAQAGELSEAIIKESVHYELDPVFVLAVIETESQFNPLAKGLFGEIGLMQIKPDTAAWIAGKYNMKKPTAKTLENPKENIKIGVAYFAFLRSNFNRDARGYLSAYNLGPRKYRRMIANNQVPQVYASKVMGNYIEIYQKFLSQQSEASKI